MADKIVQLKDQNDNNIYPIAVTAPIEDISNLYEITSTTGTLIWIHAYKYGKIIDFSLRFQSTAQVAPGGNVFAGTLSGGPLPISNAKIIGFMSSSPLMCNLTDAGVFNVRVCSGSDYPSGSQSTISGMFLTSD